MDLILGSLTLSGEVKLKRGGSDLICLIVAGRMGKALPQDQIPYSAYSAENKEKVINQMQKRALR